jgi:hypothetical protein
MDAVIPGVFAGRVAPSTPKGGGGYLAGVMGVKSKDQAPREGVILPIPFL